MNNMEKKTKVFFYGTLKKGQPNSELVDYHGCQFVCEAISVQKWPLIIGTDYNVPFLLNKKGFGKNVHGEVYLIDEKAREFFDEFESGYAALPIEVKDKSSGKTHECLAYMLENFKPSLLTEDRILFDNYSAKNDFYPEYKKKQDTIDTNERDSAYSTLKN